MNALAKPTETYDIAVTEVEAMMDGEAVRMVTRLIGKVAAQKAMSRALMQVAGNVLARLSDHDDAAAFHGERAVYHRAKAARHMAIGRRR